VQAERLGEWLPVVASYSAPQPVGLGLVEVSGVDYSVVDEPATHAASGVWLTFDGIQPPNRIRTRVQIREVGDDMQQAGVVNGE
jgi:hypothetical protein